MHITPVGHHSGLTKAINPVEDRVRKVDLKSPRAIPVDPPMPRATDEIPNDGARPADTTGALNAANGNDRVPGVVRLLEAGHFKGVADVRLRINFFDQLSERAAEARRPVVGEHANTLESSISEKVDELTGTFDIDDKTRASLQGFVDDFEASVGTAVDEGTAGVRFDKDSVTDSVRLAFETLSDSIRSLLAPPDDNLEPADEPLANLRIDPKDTRETPTADPRVPDEEPLDERPVTVDEALASLREAFEDALATFINSVDEASQLPDPTSPMGRGEAFDKFLSIYNDMRGLTPAFDDLA